MPQNEPVEEVLPAVCRELVRLLVVLEACPERASTGRLEYLSRQVMGSSVALSSDLIDTVAAVENLAATLADLHDNIRAQRCSCPHWYGLEEGCYGE